MSTVAALVRDALQHLRVLDADEAPEGADMADAIRALNLMMRRWEANGLALGWADVSTPAETLPAPPEAEEAMGYNLAVKLRARYGVSIDPDVIQLATDGLAVLRRDRMVASPLTFDRSGSYYDVYTDSNI